MLFIASALQAGTPIAKVNERPIYIEEVQRLLASTPYGSLSREELFRHPIMPSVVSDLIDAEILYLEAVKRKIPDSKEFRDRMENFRRSTLAQDYREHLIRTKVRIDAKSVAAYARKNGVKEEAARAILTAEQRRGVVEREAKRLFDRHGVRMDPSIAKLDPAKMRGDQILVTAREFRINYGDIRSGFIKYGSSKSDLLNYAEEEAVNECFSREAKRIGLNRGLTFAAKVKEYGRSLTINTLRESIERQYAPGEGEIGDYIAKHPHLSQEPREATVLMIVVQGRVEAEEIRRRARAGENFYRLATDHSIAPGAKMNAGRIPPIRIGERGYNEVDRAILDLDEGDVTEPIKGSRGYSIFKLLSITDPVDRSDADVKTIAKAEMMNVKMDGHLTKLRAGHKILLYGPDGKPFRLAGGKGI